MTSPAGPETDRPGAMVADVETGVSEHFSLCAWVHGHCLELGGDAQCQSTPFPDQVILSQESSRGEHPDGF